MNTKQLAQRISIEAIQQYTDMCDAAEALYGVISAKNYLAAYDTFVIRDTPDHSLPLAINPVWIAAEIFDLYWNTPYILSLYE